MPHFSDGLQRLLWALAACLALALATTSIVALGRSDQRDTLVRCHRLFAHARTSTDTLRVLDYAPRCEQYLGVP